MNPKLETIEECILKVYIYIYMFFLFAANYSYN